MPGFSGNFPTSSLQAARTATKIGEGALGGSTGSTGPKRTHISRDSGQADRGFSAADRLPLRHPGSLRGSRERLLNPPLDGQGSYYNMLFPPGMLYLEKREVDCQGLLLSGGLLGFCPLPELGPKS